MAHPINLEHTFGISRSYDGLDLMPDDGFVWRLTSDCLFRPFLRESRPLVFLTMALLAQALCFVFVVLLAFMVFCFLDCCGGMCRENRTGVVFFPILRPVLLKIRPVGRLLFLFPIFPIFLILMYFVPHGWPNPATAKWGVLDNVVRGLAMAKCNRWGAL